MPCNWEDLYVTAEIFPKTQDPNIAGKLVQIQTNAHVKKYILEEENKILMVHCLILVSCNFLYHLQCTEMEITMSMYR